MPSTVQVTATIGSRHISREELLLWEDRRITAAARKLQLAPPDETRPAAERRLALLDAKLTLGLPAIRRRLARDVSASDRLARWAGRLSSRRAFVQSEINVHGGTAGDLVSWFEEAVRTDDVASMIGACPDHFVLATHPDGRQEVIQATGASPLVNRFFLRYGKTDRLLTPRRPEYPYEIAAEATDVDGTTIGGARLQFCDTADGFHGLLIEEVPLLTPPWMVAQQRWHCATEFRNWTELAFG